MYLNIYRPDICNCITLLKSLAFIDWVVFFQGRLLGKNTYLIDSYKEINGSLTIHQLLTRVLLTYLIKKIFEVLYPDLTMIVHL